MSLLVRVGMLTVVRYYQCGSGMSEAEIPSKCNGRHQIPKVYSTLSFHGRHEDLESEIGTSGGKLE